MCIGRNIRKVFTLLDSKKIKSNYWEKPNNLKTEKFPFPKKKIKRKKLYEIISFHDSSYFIINY
ncbi:hypothetical protein EGP98_00845 [bacterium]|nr:hypothetical protein [bacterium]